MWDSCSRQRWNDVSDKAVANRSTGVAMDPVIAAAGRALAAGDPLGALRHVALREDAPPLALRGTAMAQLGDFERARALLRRAARAFGSRDLVARARCAVADAEIALASRDLRGNADALDDAHSVLAAHGDRTNAAHAQFLKARFLLLIGHLDAAELALAKVDPASLPAALQAAHSLALAGVAMRRVQARAAHAALDRAQRFARMAGVPALVAETEAAARMLQAPAAHLILHGQDRPLVLAEVEALLASPAFVVDACRYTACQAGKVVPLATRPVLFALLRALAEAWPDDVSRDALVTRAFRLKQADDALRALARRNGTSAQISARDGGRARDTARLCPAATACAQGGRAGTTVRKQACRRTGLARRRRGVVKFSTRGGAGNEPAQRATRRRCIGRRGQDPANRPRACAPLVDAAARGIHDSLVAPCPASARLASAHPLRGQRP